MHARHKISSAIQLPMPGNRSCIRSAALMVMPDLLFINSATHSRVKSLELIAGAIDVHHGGKLSPAWNKTRPNILKSEKTREACTFPELPFMCKTRCSQLSFRATDSPFLVVAPASPCPSQAILKCKQVRDRSRLAKVFQGKMMDAHMRPVMPR